MSVSSSNRLSTYLFLGIDFQNTFYLVYRSLLTMILKGRLLQRGKQVFPDFTSSCQRVWFGAEEKKDGKTKVVESSNCLIPPATLGNSVYTESVHWSKIQIALLYSDKVRYDHGK